MNFNHYKKFFFSTALCALISFSYANDKTTFFSEYGKQRLLVNNLMVTSGSLFHAYMGTDDKQKKLAEAYVIGVLDATEGTLWCGYNIASPSAIQEQVYLSLKQAKELNPSQRASTAIISKITKLLPCKG